MSVVTNPLIGQARQSMGGATFSRWKGIQVLKNKASTVANPQTPGQTQQRAAFALLVALFRQMPETIKAGFKKLAVKQSEFNAFTSYNLKNAIDRETPGEASIVYDDLLLSKGTMTKTDIETTVADRSANTIVITFPATVADASQTLNDTAIAAAYNQDKQEWALLSEGVLRSSGTLAITMPAGWEVGDGFNAYLGFTNPVSGDQSNSDTNSGSIVA